MRIIRAVETVVLGAALALGLSATSISQQRGGAPAARFPDKPTAVTLPAVSAEVTAPGKMFDSSTSLPPGRDAAHYKYDVREYFISGTANAKPYSTRIVVRKPSSNGKFSGLAMVEAMHPSGAAHMFEFTSDYTMTSGHMAVEVVTNLTELLTQNQERYKALKVDSDQVPEILAQVGALIKEKKSGTPFAELTTRKMVLAGTSATAAILISYLPGHMVFRTPGMQRIYDGFLPMSTGASIRPEVTPLDVPLIQVPTMTEVFAGNATTRADGDAAGDQFRLYEFAGMAHVDSRDSIRFKPNPCRYAASQFPVQAYMAVALHSLLEWSDKGKAPPRAERIALDGSRMAVDANGNVKGGIRNPYVDAPAAKFVVRNEAANPPIANPSAWIAAHGQGAPAQMCGLGGYQENLSPEQMKKLYGERKTYVERVRKSLTEMEKAGWSLPVYREMILADAGKITF